MALLSFRFAARFQIKTFQETTNDTNPDVRVQLDGVTVLVGVPHPARDRLLGGVNLGDPEVEVGLPSVPVKDDTLVLSFLLISVKRISCTIEG